MAHPGRRAGPEMGPEISEGGNRIGVSWVKARRVAITPLRKQGLGVRGQGSGVRGWQLSTIHYPLDWDRRESNPHPLIKSQVRCHYDHDPDNACISRPRGSLQALNANGSGSYGNRTRLCCVKNSDPPPIDERAKKKTARRRNRHLVRFWTAAWSAGVIASADRVSAPRAAIRAARVANVQELMRGSSWFFLWKSRSPVSDVEVSRQLRARFAVFFKNPKTQECTHRTPGIELSQRHREGGRACPFWF